MAKLITYVKCLLLILYIVSINKIYAYPTNVPTSACVNMLPSHGFDPKNSLTPYQISPESGCYTSGQTLAISISSSIGQTFRGFFVQVRKLNNNLNSFGLFDSNSNSAYTITNCFSSNNNAISHSNNNDKTKITVLWTAPTDNTFNENLEIVSTVVQSFAVIWLNIKMAIPKCASIHTFPVTEPVVIFGRDSTSVASFTNNGTSANIQVTLSSPSTTITAIQPCSSSTPVTNRPPIVIRVCYEVNNETTNTLPYPTASVNRDILGSSTRFSFTFSTAMRSVDSATVSIYNGNVTAADIKNAASVFQVGTAGIFTAVICYSSARIALMPE